MKNFFEWIKNNDSILESDLDKLSSSISKNHVDQRLDSDEFQPNDEKYQQEINRAKDILQSDAPDEDKLNQLVDMLKHSENSSVLFTNGILHYADKSLLDNILLRVPSVRKHYDSSRVQI